MKARMSWDELREDVGRFQSFLTDARIESDDRVAAMLPNMPELVVGLLGAASMVRCGPPVRPILASKASSTASARSSRKC